MSQHSSKRREGLSLVELMAVVSILAAIAAMVLPRIVNHRSAADTAANEVYKGEIDLQCHLWRRANGSWPAVDLNDIGASTDYFPEGLPTCPVDGAAYTIDAATGRVTGHNH